MGPEVGAAVAVVSAPIALISVCKRDGGLQRGDGLAAVQAVLGDAVSWVLNKGGKSM